MICPAKFRNFSPDPQSRVALVMMPTEALRDMRLGTHGISSDGWCWQRGSEVGDQTRLWVRADLSGLELRDVDIAGFSAKQVGDAPPVDAVDADLSWAFPRYMFDWLLDRPQDAILHGYVSTVGDVIFDFDRVVEQGPLVTVLRFKFSRRGWHGIAYAVVSAGQDAVDVEGIMIWNDGTVQNVRLDNARIEIRHGEKQAGQFVNAMGQQEPTPGRAPLVLLDGSTSNWMVDSMALGFFFALVAEPDVAPDADILMLDSLRLQNARAAMGGPILALAGRAAWDGRIGPHKASLPTWQYTRTPRTFNPTTVRDVWAARPNANAKASGQTGDQGIWNRCPMVHMFDDSDPINLLELNYSATDYFLRCHHYLDPSTFQPRAFETGLNDPCMTYATTPFWRIAGSAWGKNNGNNDPPWGWDHGRGYLDAQHRGNKTPALALMLTGRFVFQDELDFLLAADIRDVRIREPMSLEAPRAAGRLLQEWSWWWCVATPTQREHLQILMTRMITIIERQPNYNVSGPLKWLSVFSRFDSKNPLRNTVNSELGYEAAAPWEHSFVCDGSSACAAIFQRIGQQQLMNRCLTIAVNCANTVVNGGLIEQGENVFVVTYARVNPDGAPNFEGYLSLPRPVTQLPDGSWVGAKTDLSANCDMVYGGISLFWYSGAILVAAKANNEKARRFRNVLYQRATNQRDTEWLVGD